MDAPTHHYAAASSMIVHQVALNSSNVTLTVKQQPSTARVAIGKEKDRKPVDPPPVVKLDVLSRADPTRKYMHSPYFFMTCNILASAEHNTPSGTLGTALAGTLVSSLHKLKDGTDNNNNNTEGAYFVFADLSVKVEGWFRLQFNLYEMNNPEQVCTYVHSTVSEVFQVYSAKSWPGMNESTHLTRTFSDQGVRLRLRKEPRTLLKKRGPASEDYEPRRYRKNVPNQQMDKESIAGSDARRNSQQSPIEGGNPIDQSYSQIQDGSHRGYSSQPQDYGDLSQYDNPPKRPRTSSTHSQVPSFSQNSSVPSPQMGIQSMYAESQQSAYNYGHSTAQQSQGGFYDSSSYMPSLQSAQISRDQYYNRLPLNIATSSTYDPNSQRSTMLLHNPQANPRFPQLQYGLSSQVANNQNSSIQQRSEGVEDPFDLYGFQSRSQATIGLSGSMAPPSTGRMNNVGFGGFGTPNNLRMPYQSAMVQNQNLSAGSMGGGVFSTSRAPTSMSTTAPPSLESSYS